jgi:hypothetical protein
MPECHRTADLDPDEIAVELLVSDGCQVDYE